MRTLLTCFKYTSQRCFLKKNNFVSSHQARFIYSKTSKWDEAFATPEVLKEVEQHWKGVLETQQQNESGSGEKKYILAMFPYPSGQLHMGHVRVYTLSDAFARYYRAQGYQVIHPIGWDAFGLPAENAAIERGVSAAAWTDQNIATMKDQLKELGCSFEWWRELRTCDPEYYRWTQQLFLMLHKAGLAYKKQAFVNWDPVDETVLADEQVDEQGRAWRSGAKVQQKLLHQWYIRTTRFSKSLHDGLDSPELEEWPSVGRLQKNWIGECDGYMLQFQLAEQEADTQESNVSELPASSSGGNWLSVYTKHPELLGAVSFIAVRSDHYLLQNGYCQQANVAANKIHLDADKNKLRDKFPMLKTKAINPSSRKTIPIIVSDDLPYSKRVAEYYVGYGTGTKLDGEICEAWGIDPVQVLESSYLLEYIADSSDISVQDQENNAGDTLKEQTHLSGEATLLKHSTIAADDILINSGSLSGMKLSAARDVAVSELQKDAHCFPCSPNLKDWLISRQRFWGTPIPMICCPNCGNVPVPEDSLPVVLPSASHVDTTPNSSDSKSKVYAGLKGFEDWRKCKCPKCGGAAERETDTMDTFVDSSWYFLRFLDPLNEKEVFSRQPVDAGMPVDLYIGGMEHALLHLYFARFFQHFLESEGHTQHKEPFNRLLLIGRIKAPAYVRKSDGKYLPKEDVDFSVKPPICKDTRSTVKVLPEKMSKSKHNGVEPSSVVQQYSTDAVRMAVLRGESPTSNRDWKDDSLTPVMKLLAVVWTTVGTFVQQKQSMNAAPEKQPTGSDVISEECAELRLARNTAIYHITRNMNNFLPNSAIMQLETFIRQIRSVPLSVMKEPEYEKTLSALLVMMAPITPHLCAELWLAFAAHASLQTSKRSSVQEQSWPLTDDGFQLNIKFTCSVNNYDVYKCDMSPDEVASFNEEKIIEDLLLQNEKFRNNIDNLPIIKTELDVGDFSTKLSVYTLTEKEIKEKKKLMKLKKKQSKGATSQNIIKN